MMEALWFFGGLALFAMSLRVLEILDARDERRWKHKRCPSCAAERNANTETKED